MKAVNILWGYDTSGKKLSIKLRFKNGHMIAYSDEVLNICKVSSENSVKVRIHDIPCHLT